MTRLLLCLLVVVFFVLCAAGMRWGWRNRQRRQAAYLPEFPQVAEPDGEPLLPPATGVYVGTTTAGDWQDRIAVGDLGHRAGVEARLYDSGLMLDRTGASPLWIPAGSLVDAHTARGLAGKAMGVDGLLVVRWQLGEHQLDSGVRGDDKDTYGEWITAVQALAERGTATAGAEGGNGS